MAPRPATKRKTKTSPRVGQDYITIPNDHEDLHPDADNSPLLSPDSDGVSVTSAIQPDTYSGTVLSSVINLSNTILGAGILAMPSVFSATGLGLGVLLVFWCAFCSGMGLLLLSKVAQKVGRTSSFFSCAKITYPNIAILIDLAIAIKCFGVSISYLVISGELLPKVIGGFFPSVDVDSIWRR
jgi:Transmembrane amino acid transporter protein